MSEHAITNERKKLSRAKRIFLGAVCSAGMSIPVAACSSSATVQHKTEVVTNRFGECPTTQPNELNHGPKASNVKEDFAGLQAGVQALRKMVESNPAVQADEGLFNDVPDHKDGPNVGLLTLETLSDKQNHYKGVDLWGAVGSVFDNNNAFFNEQNVYYLGPHTQLSNPNNDFCSIGKTTYYSPTSESAIYDLNQVGISTSAS